MCTPMPGSCFTSSVSHWSAERRPGSWEAAFRISGFQEELVHELTFIPEDTTAAAVFWGPFLQKDASLIVFFDYSLDN